MNGLELLLKNLNITKDTKHHTYAYLFDAYKLVWNLAIYTAIKNADVKIMKADGIGEVVIVDVESISKLKV